MRSGDRQGDGMASLRETRYKLSHSSANDV